MKSQTKSSLNNFRIFFAASLCQRSRRAIGGLAVLLASLLLGGPGRAAQITWTNTSGGNWSGTANWSPNQVPLSADTAVITNAANYTVTMDVSPTIAGLVVGATTGVNTQTLLVSGQTLTLNGQVTVNSQGRFNFTGGTLAGAAAISGTLNWSGGTLQAGSTLTVATNGLVQVTGSGTSISGTLTNAGIIRLVSASLTLHGNGLLGLVNLPGALVDLQSDVGIGNYQQTETMVNQGTVRKSGGSGTSAILPILSNSGTVDAESGTLSLNNGDGAGLFLTGAGATLAYTGTYTIDRGGQLAGAGTNLLSSGAFTLNGSVTASNAVLAVGATLGGTNGVLGGTWIWKGGTIVAGSTLTVATNGLVQVTGSGTSISGTVTNAGTIRLVDASLTLRGNELLGLINLPGALVEMQSDVGINYWNGNEVMVNQGTVRKSGGSGTSVIQPRLNNSGILDAESGTLNLSGSYTLTGGTLNFGISSAASFGKINLAGAAVLTGTLSANLNNGFVPSRGNSFAVLSYGSQGGSFGNFILPARDAWSTNYGATTFTLTVLNSAPILSAQTNRSVNELTFLAVTNTAVDLDLPPDTLSYRLLSPPTGANIDTNGVITWTPAQTQSPGTNTITTVVTDSGTPSLSDTNSFTVVVKEVNVAPSLPTIPIQTVNALALLTVTNTATETNIHATVGYTLVNPPGNMVINASGVITWTPSRLQGPGTNTITTVVTNTDFFDTANPHLSATNSFTVIVYAPTLAPIGNYTVNAGQTVAFTNSATDNDSTRTLSFSLVSQPAGATVTPAAGVFNWRPAVSQANTTNTMQVRVTDNSAPALTDTKSFTVIVNPLGPVVLKPMGYAHGQFSMSVTGSVGPDYVLQGSVTLTNWVSLGTNTPGSMPFIFTDPAAGAFSNRFYRAKQLP